MRLVIARCSVDYVGRLTAHLPEALRLLIVKADGSVLVHSDGGSYKPLNWMSPPCRLAEEPGKWTVTGKSGEMLVISLTEVVSDTSVDLGVDPGLVKDGVEAHLQELLAVQLGLLGGPVAIGAAASGVGLRDALLIPAALAVLVAAAAGVLSPHQASRGRARPD